MVNSFRFLVLVIGLMALSLNSRADIVPQNTATAGKLVTVAIDSSTQR